MQPQKIRTSFTKIDVLDSPVGSFFVILINRVPLTQRSTILNWYFLLFFGRFWTLFFPFSGPDGALKAHAVKGLVEAGQPWLLSTSPPPRELAQSPPNEPFLLCRSSQSWPCCFTLAAWPLAVKRLPHSPSLFFFSKQHMALLPLRAAGLWGKCQLIKGYTIDLSHFHLGPGHSILHNSRELRPGYMLILDNKKHRLLLPLLV